MKNKFILLSLFLLTSCQSVVNQNNVSFSIKNIIDGDIANASLSIDGKNIDYSYNNNLYTLNKNISNDSVLEINHPRYETKRVNINKSTSSIDLSYQFKQIGTLMYNSDKKANRWKIYSTRESEIIKFKFTSLENNFISTQNVLSLYLNTKETRTKLSNNDYQFKMTNQGLFVYDYGMNHSEIDLSQFNYSFEEVDNITNVYLDIPYQFLNINYDSIIGFNCKEYIYSKDITVNMKFDNKIIKENDTTKYPRLDVKSRTFMNTVNVDDPTWISETLKEELIEDKIYKFANPEYNNFPTRCDDVYFSLDYTLDKLKFDFVGFGDFISSEFFQIVLHHNMICKSGWELTNDDVVLNVYSSKCEIYTNCSSFFSVKNSTKQEIDILTYVDYGPYFTLTLELDLSLVPCLSSNYDDLYIMAVEFDSHQIYDGKNYTENFFVNDIPAGDPANMASYSCVDAPNKRTCNLSYEEKNELIKDKNISFANPEDVLFTKADDMYMKITREESCLDIDIVGFGDLSDVETLKMVFHTASTDSSGWKIHSTDKTLLISNKESKWGISSTDFFQAVTLNNGVTPTANNVNYTRYTDYFTLKLKVNYSELGTSVTKDTPISMFAFEFGFAGVIYNSSPFTKLMRLNGEICGDPANQKNYISI